MYKEKKMNFNNIFSFWNNFRDKEKFLFYNPNKKEILIGAKRLKSFKEKENFNGYKYIFSIKTFFNDIKDSIWNGFNSENIVFSYYLKITKDSQLLYYEGEGSDLEFNDIDYEEEFYNYFLENKDYGEWEKLFNNSHSKILNNEAEKIVISREVAVTLSKEAKEEFIIKRLIDNNRQSFIFAYKKGEKCFLGATPEILVEKVGTTIISHAVAGTLIKDKNDKKEDFLNDEKNSYEQNIVVSNIKKLFDKFGENTKVSERELIETKNLYHLHTILKTSSNENIITWRDRLHPTPALGGMPKEIALQTINDNENHERGLYSSPIGLIDETGDGIFVVGIRSGLLYKDKLYVYAGCGIVEASECEKEYVETAGKLKTILESL